MHQERIAIEGVIEVYKDWSADEPPKRLGTLRVRSGRTGERFECTFDDDALADRDLSKQMSSCRRALRRAKTSSNCGRVSSSTSWCPTRTTIFETTAFCLRRTPVGDFGGDWSAIAASLGVKKAERDDMAAAFTTA
jgi:hypothetical protein